MMSEHIAITPRRVVTFAASHTSILIPSEVRDSPLRPRERARALTSRKATPHKTSKPRGGDDAPSS
eukprot:CAMPEP_0172567940 /NCGR_PEP_ID=MMETSP1067-20121228/117839_1 /TAXON_ID=265564 ORGANISM="Thalassiosira punctigera, Strain Tpunct2005C2" /NCGR_SAMPLE_ID=MMETSP1067 /ASSEMBLY_ACC=CAM_ASM_000444 /LENGTH=65 /DNA_ID=CAMNT_0013359403 /DNA_START=60 /DNA_END=254 /DNA_ORIENTATION=+